MNHRTSHVVVHAGRDDTFRFLSDVENLPRWAVHFCKELKQVGDDYKVVTPSGELFFRMESDSATGVIDMLAGPVPEQLAVYPSRVVGLPDGTSLYSFTNIQYPGVDDATFDNMCASLADEFAEIRRQVESRAKPAVR